VNGGVRTNLADGAARVMLAVVDGFMILLHGFVKKAKKTPKSDLELARARLKAYTDAQEEREESR
jgi:phage-related protein